MELCRKKGDDSDGYDQNVDGEEDNWWASSEEDDDEPVPKKEEA